MGSGVGPVAGWLLTLGLGCGVFGLWRLWVWALACDPLRNGVPKRFMSRGVPDPGTAGVYYRGTSLIRNKAPLGPYIRIMPMALWWS